MTVVYMHDYLEREQELRPRRLSFFSPTYRDADGRDKSLNINVNVMNGDVDGILSAVREDGGIGRESEDGTFYFLPWPCAAVEIRDIDPDDIETLEPNPLE